MATARGCWRCRDADRQGRRLRGPDDEMVYCVVLDEVAGDRHLPIEIGQPEAFNLAAHLGGIE